VTILIRSRKKRKRHNAFRTLASSISLTSFATNVDSTTHLFLPIPKGSTNFYKANYNYLCEYGSASGDEGLDGDDYEDDGHNMHDLYFEDNGGDREEVDDDKYIRYGHTFTWKFDDSPTNPIRD